MYTQGTTPYELKPLIPDLNGQPLQVPPQRPKTDEEIKAFLRNYEVIALGDESTSMGWAIDESGDYTGWDQLREVMAKVVKVAMCYDHNGVELAFFGSTVEWLPKKVETNDDVKRAFNKKPRGGTNLSDALQQAFNRHLEHRKKKEAKGLKQKTIILIFTDGEPDNKARLLEVIRKFNEEELRSDDIFDYLNPDGTKVKKTLELGMRFFQVGNDKDAKAFLQELDDHPPSKVDNIDTGILDDLKSDKDVRKAFVDAIWD